MSQKNKTNLDNKKINMEKIKIFIADDHAIVRRGITSLFQSNPDYTVVGEAEDGMSFLENVTEANPDIIIMDITMPHIDGLMATKRITEDLPETKVIILSMHRDRNFVIDAFRAGAMAYVVKGGDTDDITTAVERVTMGKKFVSPCLSDELFEDFVHMIQSNKSLDPINYLSKREKEVLQLVASSYKSKEISEKLFISIATVKTHRSNIMKKLKVNDLTGLIKIAIRQGFVKSH